MKPYFKVPIESAEDGEKFFRQLAADNLLFHPEDDPVDIVSYDKETKIWSPLFDLQESRQIRKRLDEAWLYMSDPCEFILENLI